MGQTNTIQGSGKRLPAERITIKNLYLSDNSLATGRYHIVGTVVGKTGDHLLVDDGTGKIPVRLFQAEYNVIDTVSLGDMVRIIGRFSAAGAESFVSAEILKKVSNPLWFDFHLKVSDKKVLAAAPKSDVNPVQNVQVKEETYSSLIEQIVKIVRENDKGSGVSIEEVSRMINDPKFDSVISGMIRDGNAFEIEPGIIKLLE